MVRFLHQLMCFHHFVKNNRECLNLMIVHSAVTAE